MNTLLEVAKQTLAFTMRDFSTVRDFEAARAVLQDTIRSALVEEEKAVAWLAERKDHWRKEREKAQAAKDQDPELSAALGWPGGISDPVLDRTQLLQMVAALRVSAQQALEALEYAQQDRECPSTTRQAITALRAALAQEQAQPLNLSDRAVQKRLAAQWGYVPAEQAEPDLSRCPQCNGPADNGHDRSIPPNPYLCTKCMAEPCPNCASLEAQNTELDRKLAEMEQAEPKPMHPELRKMWEEYFDRCFRAMPLPAQEQAKPVQAPVAWVECDGELVWNNREEAIGRNLYTAPPRRTMLPLTAQQLDGVIERHVGGSEITDDVYASMEQFARVIEKASWEKNHGQT